MTAANEASTGSSWASFFSQHIDGQPRIPERSWLDKWSWVAMLAMRFWVSSTTSSIGRGNARLLLVEELRQGARILDTWWLDLNIQ